MIELVVFDIDGVITDGSVIIDSNGNEQKKINLKDVDAIFELHRRGFRMCAITGENTEIVNFFEKKFPWEFFFKGNKTKLEALKKIEKMTNVEYKNICYVGDGKYDVDPLMYAGLGLCPSNAIDKAKVAADIVLQNRGGEGCIWEVINILEDYNNPNCTQNFLYQRLHEHTTIFKQLVSNKELVETVMKCGDKIIDIFQKGGQVFLCGNGGSAADAQHIATEFVSRFYKERLALNAEALTTNTSTLTAVGNDYSFERIFVRQLEAKAREGDIVIGITTSGKSKNVLEALRYAKRSKMSTVLMMGEFDTELIDDMVDFMIKVPSFITPRIQEAHIFLGHVMAEYIEHTMFGEKRGSEE